MPIFISYSRADRDFVDRLAKQLLARHVSIWLDKWELHVGDSLITKIQEAITGASGLLIVLSKNSVKSEWCKKELNSGLIRELEEKRVVILPLLLEDCDIPIFLREKLYADFRSDFDEGLRTILEAVARVTNEWRARVTEPGWHTDSAIDWGKNGSDHIFRITMVEQANNQPYCVLGVTSIIARGPAAEWYQSHIDAGTADEARARVIYALADAVRDDDDFNVLLKDHFEVSRRTAFTIEGRVFAVISSVRWLGMDTGRDVLFRMGGQLAGMAEGMFAIRKPPPTASSDPVTKVDDAVHPHITPDTSPKAAKLAAKQLGPERPKKRADRAGKVSRKKKTPKK